MPSGLRQWLEDAIDTRLAAFQVRQSLVWRRAFNPGAGSGPTCAFCDEPPQKGGLCQGHWDEVHASALADVKRQRRLRAAQRDAVGPCPDCHDGRERYKCHTCGAGGRQALTGYLLCPDCHGTGLKYGHTPCTACGELGFLEEAAFYATLPAAQAEALRRTLAAHGLDAPRLARRLEDIGWALQLSIYDGDYHIYDLTPDGAVTPLGGVAAAQSG